MPRERPPKWPKPTSFRRSRRTQAPVYKRMARGAATEALSELASSPSYVKATSKEWVQMIVQPNKLDERDWPARVGSELRCVTDGHL